MFCFDSKEFPKGITFTLHFSPERGCVEDQPQPTRTVQTRRLVVDETAALRHSASIVHGGSSVISAGTEFNQSR
jgi:hypothetical protein